MIDKPLRERLPEVREELIRLAALHGGGNLRVFGSVARGDDAEGSDLDLLVDMDPGRGLFDLIAIGQDIEERTGIKTDVLTVAFVSPLLRDRVLAEARPL